MLLLWRVAACLRGSTLTKVRFVFCHFLSENETHEWYFTLLCKHLLCIYLSEIISFPHLFVRWCSFSIFMHMALKQVEVSYASWGPQSPCYKQGGQEGPVHQQCQDMGIVMYRWKRRIVCVSCESRRALAFSHPKSSIWKLFLGKQK